MKKYSLFLILILQFCKAGGDCENKKSKGSRMVAKQSNKSSKIVEKNYNLPAQHCQMLKTRDHNLINENQNLKKQLEDLEKKKEDLEKKNEDLNRQVDDINESLEECALEYKRLIEREREKYKILIEIEREKGTEKRTF